MKAAWPHRAAFSTYWAALPQAATRLPEPGSNPSAKATTSRSALPGAV
jgi:hypothetical protein